MNDLAAGADSDGATSAASPLVIRRAFDTRIEALWQAWTDPTEWCRWMGPESIDYCELLAFELRVGGRYRLRMHADDGQRHVVFGTYREIVAPTRLKFSWQWEGESDPPSLVIVDLSQQGPTAAMTLTHAEFPSPAVRELHDQGWQGCFDKLGALLT